MLRFEWLAAGPIPTAWDLRRLGWRLCETSRAADADELHPLLATPTGLAFAEWLSLTSAAPRRRGRILQHPAQPRAARGLGVVVVDASIHRRAAIPRIAPAKGQGRAVPFPAPHQMVEHVGPLRPRHLQGQLHCLGVIDVADLVLVRKVTHRARRIPQLEALPVDARPRRRQPPVGNRHRPQCVGAILPRHARRRLEGIAHGALRRGRQVIQARHHPSRMGRLDGTEACTRNSEGSHGLLLL